MICSIGVFGQSKKELVDAKKAEIQALKDLLASKEVQLNQLKKDLSFTEINTDTLSSKKPVISRAKKGNKVYWYLSNNGNNYLIKKMTIVLNADSINYYFNMRNDSLIVISQFSNETLFTIP